MSVVSRAAVAASAIAPLLLLGCTEQTPAPPAVDTRLEASRTAAMKLGAELKSRLVDAMSEHGPEAAVNVCAEQAPAIAQQLSETSGAGVSRTALRVRNPDNAPAPWQVDVLHDFVAQLKQTGSTAVPEYAAATDDGGYRYMKAIVMAPECLSCHGNVPDGPLADAIKLRYPNDTATGFTPGELRGAFVVEWRQPQ